MISIVLKPHSTTYTKSLLFDRSGPLVNANQLRGSPKDAIDNVRAQTWATDKTKMVELTYGPKKPTATKFEPKYVKMDKMILTFDGVIRSASDDWETEKERVRFVKVHYFLENDTIKVMEPVVKNSMLNQGLLIRQDRYLTPDRKRDYNWKDLNIGVDLDIFGRKIHLYNCDPYTREYLTQAGIDVSVAEPKAEDPFEEIHDNMASRKELRRSGRQDPLAKFYMYGGKLLRFYGFWTDDRDPENPVVRRILLKYLLGEDAVEVQENYQESSGWGPLLPPTAQLIDNFKSSGGSGSFKTILSKQRVLLNREKDVEKLPCYLEPGDLDDVTWLGPEHFRTDQEVMILGKRFYLAKCDEFTSHFYRERFGVELPQIEVLEKIKTLPPKTIPPHSIGTYEETLEDCYHPWERPPKRRLRMPKIKPAEISNTVLRFAAIMDTPRETEQIRRFIVSLFMEDDTIKIHELNVENSGFGRGTFWGRSRLRKDWGPTHEKTPALAKGAPPQYYEVEDLYIGAKIKANGATFILRDADDKVFHFMADHPEIYKDLNVEEQKRLANILKGNREVTQEERCELEADLRRSVLLNYGCSPFPMTHYWDLGDNPAPRTKVQNKLYSANLPIEQRYINRLLDSFTFEGMTDVIEVQNFILKALGHKVTK